MSEMDNLMNLINEQNKILERIAKAIERAYPSVTITAHNEITEEMLSPLRRIESTRGDYYRPTLKWEC